MPTRSEVRVDGVTVYTGPGGTPFTQIILRMNAPSWRPAFDSSFDDFTFTPAMASSYSLFGAGCAGSAGVPTLVAPASGPQIGATLALTIQSLPITSAVFGILGISNTSLGGAVPLPLELSGVGMPGCRLLVSTEWIGFVPRLTPSTAQWNLPIPYDASLLGGAFYQQAAVLDPAANALGVVLSNAGSAVIGYY